MELMERLSSAYERNYSSGAPIPEAFFEAASKLTVAQRLALIDRCLSAEKGKSASDVVRDLFPELARLEIVEAMPPIPDSPPEWWSDARQRGEEIGPFVRRVWGTWIGHGLTKADLRKDPILYHDLAQVPNRAVRLALNVPSLSEANDDLLVRLSSAREGGPLSALAVLADRRSLDRLILMAAHRARGRTNSKP